MKDLPPDCLMGLGGWQDTLSCEDCKAIGDMWTLATYRPCPECGGKVEWAGARKWYQPRNPEWRWWRFWWPRHLPGRWIDR